MIAKYFNKYLAYIVAKPVISAAVAIVVLGGGYFIFFHKSGDTGATLTVHKGNFEQQVSISGTVVAAEKADLGFAQSGRIAGVYAKVGDHVGAGAVLAAIENGDLQAAVDQKQAALLSAQAKLASLQAGTRSEQIVIDETTITQDEQALRDAIRSAYVSADDAVHKQADQFFSNGRTPSAALAFISSNSQIANRLPQERIMLEGVLNSWQSLLASAEFASADPQPIAKTAHQNLLQVATFLDDASTALAAAQPVNTTYQADINTARTTLSGALSALTTAESALAGARGDLALAKAGSPAEDIVAQAAQVKAAEADVSSAKANLYKTFVVAPFTGVVSKMDVKKGEIVNANTSEISMLSQGVFQIETYIPEVNISGIAVGNGATTTLDAYGQAVTFASKVVAVDPAETLKNGVPTYKTTMIFLATDARIRSGMTANVVITTGMEPDAIVIPQGAVLTIGSDTFVDVLKDGSSVRIKVEKGATSALGLIEILSGLQDGDVILLNPS